MILLNLIYTPPKIRRDGRKMGNDVKRVIKFVAVGVASILFGLLTSCSKQPEYDEHYGMIEVPYSDRTIWITPKEGAELNTLKESDFTVSDSGIEYTGGEKKVLYGIDVSNHQGDIDWVKVKNSGIDFVYIRAGYRGYTEGLLHNDARFYQNIRGAKAAGLRIGVYFFSQAINLDEVEKEAEYFKNLISGYKDDITLPVIYDWEVMDYRDSRTKYINVAKVTDFARLFCSMMEEEGYQTGIYFNRHDGYDFDLAKIQDLTMWFAGLQNYPNFYYRVDMWQYSFTGQVDGVPGEVDLDMLFIDE